MHRGKIAHFIILLFNVQLVLAQNIVPTGFFVQEHIKIGEELSYSLSVQYDKSQNVLFPDSTYHFGTFEYNSRSYFKTRSDDTYSFDSVVYHFATFEIDSIQFLRLPIFILEGEDSLTVYSTLDSILLDPLIKTMPENPELKADTSFINIKKQFNYPYFLIAVGMLVFIAFVVALFFGNKLAKAWKVYRMNNVHKRFIARFFNLMRDVSSNNPTKTPEHVLAFWKRYMERLEKMPISKLTTKEILVLHNNGQLKDHLRLIDRSIYAGEKVGDLFPSFDYLMQFSIEIYNQKITEIKNG